VSRVLAASYDELLTAYGRACFEHDYVWTAERVAALRKTSLVMKNNASQREEAQRIEAWDLRDAESQLKLIAKARRAGASPQDRVEAFRKVAKEDGFQLRAIVALALVAGQDDAA